MKKNKTNDHLDKQQVVISISQLSFSSFSMFVWFGKVNSLFVFTKTYQKVAAAAANFQKARNELYIIYFTFVCLQ